MSRRLKLAAVVTGGIAVAGCVVGPDYSKPDTPMAVSFKELKGWTPGAPADAIDRGTWWQIFNDPLLDDLERRIDIDNQNLKAYEAAYRAARATVDYARSSYYPTVSAGPSYERSRARGSYVTSTGGDVEASWVPDLWGRVRRLVESDVASAQASAAELASVRLSAQTDLANDYFQLRYEDSLQRLLDETVAAYQRSLQITQNQYDVGVAARSDVVEAQTQLLNTEAQATAVASQRAQYEHAIALLVGKPPSDLTIAAAALTDAVPPVPVAVPSALLQRRPDIAEAERRMQEQNALIGVAIAAYYPTVTLSASDGISAIGLGALTAAGSQVWTLAASGTELLFDGGSRAAQVAEARATYDQAVANYRQTVLAAFQNVEDQLAIVRVLGQQAVIETDAVIAARRSEEIALNEYRAGTQAYTTVVTAQATALSTRQTALGVQRDRLNGTVSLIAALGGGWSTAQLPSAADLGG